jgi:hypothetical protein
MLINEAGLVRAIKRAYKADGYTVNVQNGIMSIYTKSWYIQARQKMVPRKALAAIVEHAGLIPGENEPINIMKDLEPQLVIPETAAEEMSAWRVGERGDDVDLVPVIMQGFQIFQAESLACWGIPLSYLGMVERDAAEHDSAIVVDNCRLLWDDGTEAIAVEDVRKAKSGWAKAWERAVWEALEGVDLHKEEE